MAEDTEFLTLNQWQGDLRRPHPEEEEEEE